MYGRATETAQIVAALTDLADRIKAMPLTSFPETFVRFDLQVGSHAGTEEERMAAVRLLCKGILGIDAGAKGTSQYGAPVCGINLDHINVDIFTGVESEKERKLRQENEDLRAQLARFVAP